MKELNKKHVNQSESFIKSACLQEIQLSYKRKTKLSERIKITSSLDIFQFAQSIWNKDTLDMQETFYTLFLDGRNSVLGFINLAQGAMNGVLVDNKILFATAVKSLASAIILLHNHPSGSLYPSEADRNLTKKIQKAALLLDIRVIDHLIITSENYLSFADEGLL